jgi:crotonobetainyl-CoA:carnitine CoA-transferase CaiB-like acyl-CoA transferase
LRGFFEEVEHPVTGKARYSTVPVTFSRGPDRRHLRHAPLLGQDNHAVLAELGLTESEIAALEADGVIGQTPERG